MTDSSELSLLTNSLMSLEHVFTSILLQYVTGAKPNTGKDFNIVLVNPSSINKHFDHIFNRKKEKGIKNNEIYLNNKTY